MYNKVDNPNYIEPTTKIPLLIVNELVALLVGTHLSNPIEVLDLDQGSSLRDT